MTACAGMRSETAVRTRRQGAAAVEEDNGRAFSLVSPVKWAWLDLNQRPHPYQGSAPSLFPQDRTCNLRERPTAGDRWRPLRTARLRWRVDQTWTKAGAGQGGPVLSGRGRLRRFGPPRLGTDFGPDRLAGHGKADHGLDRRSPACKASRAGSLPAEGVNGAGRGRPGAVRGCLPGTSHVCCEWARLWHSRRERRCSRLAATPPARP
jgi:hypothetical protein